MTGPGLDPTSLALWLLGRVASPDWLAAAAVFPQSVPPCCPQHSETRCSCRAHAELNSLHRRWLAVGIDAQVWGPRGICGRGSLWRKVIRNQKRSENASKCLSAPVTPCPFSCEEVKEPLMTNTLSGIGKRSISPPKHQSIYCMCGSMAHAAPQCQLSSNISQPKCAIEFPQFQSWKPQHWCLVQDFVWFSHCQTGRPDSTSFDPWDQAVDNRAVYNRGRGDEKEIQHRWNSLQGH